MRLPSAGHYGNFSSSSVKAAGLVEALDSEAPNSRCSCLSPEIRPNQETIMPTRRTGFAAPLLLIVLATLVPAQKTDSSDAAYIAQALSAAPEAVAKDATVVRMEKEGKISTLCEGKRGTFCWGMHCIAKQLRNTHKMIHSYDTPPHHSSTTTTIPTYIQHSLPL